MIRLLAKSSVILAVLLLTVSAARACNVPLFRYALERWRPDAYQFVVLYEPPAPEVAALDQIKSYADQRANLTIEYLDVTKISAADREKLTELYSIKQFPWLVVRSPAAQTDRAVWHGPLQDAPIVSLIESRARNTIAQRILDGESAVWVLLESGNYQADRAAEEKLRKCLERLEETMKLPELTNSPKDKLLRDEPPLLLVFSILRISRHDPQEAFFRQILLHTEADLAARKEPIVFPVFGRGIALYALVGKGINDETITEAANLLVGACRCEIKKLNPGTDLLMAADWEGPPEPAVAAAPAAVAAAPLGDMNRNLFIALFATLVVVAVVTAIIYLRRKELA